MGEHTPTPWASYTNEVTKIRDGHSALIATMSYVHLTGRRAPGETEANAAFIVKAVNSHEALVKALEAGGPAIDNLSTCQEQCDFDGVIVKVSRQAVEETLDVIRAFKAALANTARSSTGSEQESSIPKVAGSSPAVLTINSHVAQSVEPAAHNSTDVGSNPTVGTTTAPPALASQREEG